MSSFHVCVVASVLAATAAQAAAQTPTGQHWDAVMRNARGFTLREADIAAGGRAAYVNGEWQGNFRFTISNCPGAGCRTIAGTALNPSGSPGDRPSVYDVPGAACALHFALGADKQGYDDGLVLTLVATDAPGAGCKPLPAAMAGRYRPE